MSTDAAQLTQDPKPKYPNLKTMKISIRNLSAVALVGLALTAHSAPFTVPNGTFTMAGGEDWNQNGSGGTVITYETSGGNLDGYGKIDNTAGAWGGVLVAEGEPVRTRQQVEAFRSATWASRRGRPITSAWT